jgi:hypothetical protein
LKEEYGDFARETKVPEWDKDKTYDANQKIIKKFKDSWELLRKLFALASMELLKYDFVVLDEFQNFNDILQKANQTRIENEQYREQAKYIYNVVDSYEGNDKNDEIAGIKKCIKETFDNIGSVDCDKSAGNESVDGGKSTKITEYEKKIWSQNLKSLKITDFNINSIIEEFLELSKPDIQIKVGEKTDNDDSRRKILELVKAILDFEKKDDDKENIIKNAYEELNKFAEHEKKWEELSTISYIEDGIEKNVKSQEWYGKNSLKHYYIHNYLYNMYLKEDFNGFEKTYKEIRNQDPRKGEPLSKIPFDYCIYLFLENDENSPDKMFLINCFQYFYKKNNRDEESKLVWQYTNILYNSLKVDANRFKYSVEQLEPYRKMNGLYDRKSNYEHADEHADEQMLLNHIFKNEVEFKNKDEGDKITRILMLSATPFKMYDNNDDDSQKNANIKEVCDFLDQNAKRNVSDKLIDYKKALLDYSNSSRKFEEVDEKKKEFEKSMKSIFNRMERYAVLRDVDEKWFEHMLRYNDDAEEKEHFSNANSLELTCGKIHELRAYIKEVDSMKVESPFINFAVDSPYMGTFMHSEKKGTRTSASADEEIGYKWKSEWKKKYENEEIEYNGESKVYISYEDFMKNEKPLGLWHGVFDETLKKLLDLDKIEENNVENHPGAARLLWVPSCVSKNKLDGPFKEHEDYGKTIVFSRYMQTPRMLACLTSYESRRRLCCMIEDKWKEKHPETEFKTYLKKLIGPENSEGEESTYQLLKSIMEKDKYIGDIREKLLEDGSFIRYFDTAIRNFYNKRYKERKDEICADEKKIGELVTGLTKDFAKKVILHKEQGLLAIWASYGFPDIETPLKDSKEEFANECVKKILEYCEAGALGDVLDEWFYICCESNQDFGEFIGLKEGKFLSFIKSTQIGIDLYKDKDGKIEECKETPDLYFARCIGIMGKDDDNLYAVKGLQQSFNSPFAPFVFATTSMGQEGLDFHHYADKIVHWKLPSNPVDFEQREGRINRYHCLAIRKKVIEWWADDEAKQQKDVYGIFEKAFKNAKDALTQEKSGDNSIKKCEIIPDWILMDKEKKEIAQIKRIVPYFYLSKMAKDYNMNLKILQLYRTVIGQANPEEIMERLMNGKEAKEIEKLFVDFSPYSKGTNKA